MRALSPRAEGESIDSVVDYQQRDKDGVLTIASAARLDVVTVWTEHDNS